MLTKHLQEKIFQHGESGVTITKDLITNKISVKFKMPTQLTSVKQIDGLIELLRETREEIENDLKRNDSKTEHPSEPDSETQG